MAYPYQPSSRADFYIAIICALPRESDAVALLFDEFWDDDGDTFGRSAGDTNTYTTGRIGKHNVVLAVLPNIGTTTAAAAAASMQSSYTNLRLALLVGICGGIPTIAGQDALLGDVIVSKTVIQYDYGRLYPGSFQVTNIVEDSLGRANKDVRGLVTSFETELGRERLQEKAATYLLQLQDTAARKRRRADYRYPGPTEDKLFPPDYLHVHRTLCGSCTAEAVRYCELASTSSCAEIPCDEARLVARKRLQDMQEVAGSYAPEIFIGRLGSGNTVMKSGTHRDRIAAEHEIIAFEMEGAGVWDEAPCIVIKGICDYADSHKNKRWQDFAAATAACVAKAILGRYVLPDGLGSSSRSAREAETLATFDGSGGTDNGQGNGSSRTISGNQFGDQTRIVQGDIHGNHSF